MKNCLHLLLVASLSLGLMACSEDKKNNVNTDYRVETNSELKPEQHSHQTIYDNRQVHQVAHARFQREEARKAE